ncbi:radical SAM protein [Acidomonas methanolica]|uniref:Radical SAM domain protein n=1 Tax=Acidomonas methanolica NBRC 104435 TaxID=1231351 RepID=A0A023DAL9_ACIMT|nr:radical SAM protein [Acidomonas methanolica]MBU2655661.1 radical SAM protein [Acidomonas methanolica]MCQ9156289.1 radical SAM protein [Acidomonas methanolica]TCS21280.1 MoaA/NifB/PqqE/SkfB family radical SAM enzyme [Acidomonas methanolica]GAJ30765.1 radical SAM domain protein [Acidomonas methanolica NBRC 104435]GBQ48886.1 radical SAM domain protein [Acidomonas methanolica]
MKKPPLATRLSTMGAGLRFAAKAVGTRYTPLLAQLVVTRRCNLACGYCNEYDDFSSPVPTEVVEQRIAHLAALGTASLTLTGGEPLLHPDLDRLVRFARDRGMIVTTITNGFRLSRSWIERLNAAGLQGMQVSIDNLQPDEISMKSLSSVEGRLALLSEHARFKVNVNSVMGVTGARTQDIVTIAETAARYGLQHSVGVLHDHSGLLKPLSPEQKAAYKRVTEISPSIVHKLNYHLFQKNLMDGQPNAWKCRAGARYLYITEDGAVHWCSQQRGRPGKALLEYTRDDIRREYATEKTCSPTCTLSCVHQMSLFDRYRGAQSKRVPRAEPKPVS